MQITIPYKPHTQQLQLHNCESRFRVLVCGRRWGKTIFAINELIKCAIETKGDYWYIAPTYRQAKLIAWVKLKYYAVEKIVKKINEADLLITFVNGSTIRLLGADNEDSLRGVGLRGVVLDEFADFKDTTWETVIRPMLSDYQGWAIFLGTPKGKLNPLYEKYIRDKEKADKHYLTIHGESIDPDENYKSFQFKTSDNPYIALAEIEMAKRELAPQYFRQEYEASFENYTGLIYKEFDTAKHIIKDFQLKDWWNMYVGIDTGRYTAVSFIAMDDKGIAYLFDEVYDYDSIVADITRMIENVLLKWKIKKDRVRFFIDSASQVKNEYRFNNINAYDSKKDVENQIALVRNRFATDTLYFHDICKMHIIEHQGYVWDDKSKKLQPKKENDHSCSSTQYVFSTYTTYSSVDIEAKKKYEATLEYAAMQKDFDSSEGYF
jgi:hypothetical protein